MEFKLLGPVEVRIGGSVVPLSGAKQRALLALLLLHANEVVSRDRLIDELWGEVWTPSAGHRLETQISRLRKTLQLNGRLVSDRGGYALEVEPSLIDACRFEGLLEEGRRVAAAGQTAAAAQTLRDALSLWRGGALADLAYEPFARSEIERLEELRVAAIEERVDLDLALGRHREVLAELDALAGKHPLRERLRGQLMLALYRSGRHAEALEGYQAFRRNLSEELGLEPGPGLQRLELAILRRDPTLALPETPSSRPAPEAEVARAARPLRRGRLLVLLAGAVLLVLAAVAALRGGSMSESPIAGDSIGAIGPSGTLAGPSVPLGSSPSVLAAGVGALWAANYNSGTVSRVDPRRHVVVETIPGVSTPTGIALAANDVWVTDSYAGTVSRIDPVVDRVVQTISVGNAPAGAAAGYGSVWVANSNDGTLTRIDASSGDVLKTIALGAGATSVVTGLGGVWVSDAAGDRVFRVDPQTDQVTGVINVGTGPTGLAVGFGSVWVANSLDGTVSRIDPQTNTVTATVDVGDGAGAVAIGDGGVWVSSQYAGTVSRIDPASDAVVRTVRVGNRPQGLALAAGLVWVGIRPAATSHRGGTLRVLSIGNADTMDPLLTQNLIGVLPLTYDGLTAYQRVGGNGSVQLVPDLAVSLPSPTDGGTTYTFQLRRGIRFSNGELVRPEDFRRALERDLVLGGNSNYGGPFADVVGGAACAAHRGHCDLSGGVVTDDAANTVTFHLVAPNPEFLQRLTLLDAVAVPVETPLHDIGLHPLPTTGPYEWIDVSRDAATLVRNPYFHEWSHAARPDGYPDRILFRHIDSAEAGVTAVERSSADYFFDGVAKDRMSEVETRFPSQLYITPTAGTIALIVNTRTLPFTDIRVRQAINYAVDRTRAAQLLGQGSQPACQILPAGLPGYRRYCPYTVGANPAGAWQAPDLAHADQLIAASGTRGTPITIWNLDAEAYGALDRYLVSLLDRLGYPTHVKDFSGADPNAPVRFADSRTGAQAALYNIPIGPLYPSASQILQANFSCQSFAPGSAGNSNWSELCDHRLDTQINTALAAESNNSPDTAALWARADRTATDQAPAVPLTTTSDIHLISQRTGNYQYSFQQGVLLDQLWVR